MQTQKQIQGLINRLNNIYSGTPWYGTDIQSSLAKVNAESGLKPKIPGKRSIAEIIRHMVAWRSYLLEHLKGNSDFDIEIDSETDWPSTEGMSWQEVLAELEASQRNILACLQPKTDDWLKETIGKRQFNFRFLIEGIIQHDIYHLGQINMLNNLP